MKNNWNRKVSFNLTKEQKAKLKRISKGNQSEWLRKKIDEEVIATAERSEQEKER